MRHLGKLLCVAALLCAFAFAFAAASEKSVDKCKLCKTGCIFLKKESDQAKCNAICDLTVCSGAQSDSEAEFKKIGHSGHRCRRPPRRQPVDKKKKTDALALVLADSDEEMSDKKINIGRFFRKNKCKICRAGCAFAKNSAKCTAVCDATVCSGSQSDEAEKVDVKTPKKAPRKRLFGKKKGDKKRVAKKSGKKLFGKKKCDKKKGDKKGGKKFSLFKRLFAKRKGDKKRKCDKKKGDKKKGDKKKGDKKQRAGKTSSGKKLAWLKRLLAKKNLNKPLSDAEEEVKKSLRKRRSAKKGDKKRAGKRSGKKLRRNGKKGDKKRAGKRSGKKLRRNGKKGDKKRAHVHGKKCNKKHGKRTNKKRAGKKTNKKPIKGRFGKKLAAFLRKHGLRAKKPVKKTAEKPVEV